MLHPYATIFRKLKTSSYSLGCACPLLLMLMLLILLAACTFLLTLEGVILKNLRLVKDNHKLYLKRVNYYTICTWGMNSLTYFSFLTSRPDMPNLECVYMFLNHIFWNYTVHISLVKLTLEEERNPSSYSALYRQFTKNSSIFNNKRWWE